MSEKSPLKCSECGREALDPYCIENCPRHLCEECGQKCAQQEDPDSECEECPYEPDDELEEMEDLRDEEAELETGEDDYY